MAFTVQTIDHIGLVVNDFDTAKQFFEDFGFTTENEQDIQGDLLNKVMGIPDAKSHVAFMVSPGSQIKLELTTFLQPQNITPTEKPQINTLGMQHLALVVKDLDGIIKELKDKNYDFITGVETHANILKVCYFRGPDNIILELAELTADQ